MRIIVNDLSASDLSYQLYISKSLFISSYQLLISQLIKIDSTEHQKLCSMTSSTVDNLNSIPEPYDSNSNDLTILEEIGKSKATVFRGHMASIDDYVAVKMFPYEERRVSKDFVNEVRYDHLEHPNIISVFDHSKKQTLGVSDGHNVNVSLIVMELAPHGDFFNALITQQIFFDTTLARTYFRQLIEGMEYMHSNSVAHQDLKLDNLLIGDDYKLKISDFDVAWTKNQAFSKNSGTAFYRSPEVCKKNCIDPRAADVYAAGVLLFLFKCGGTLPHSENELYEGLNLRDLLENDNQLFWKKHREIQERSPNFFDDDFKGLFNGMTCVDPEKRFSIEKIKNSEWYQGRIYSGKRTISIMAKALL